jgi:hypothetical protein
MNSIARDPEAVKTCEDCAYGEYHRAQPGRLEQPPQAAYYDCRHPRVCREAVYDPALLPDEFRCRFWLYRDPRTRGDSDAAAMDADVMPFSAWRDCWRVDWLTGELVTL